MPAQTTLAPSEQTTGQDDLAAVLERLSLTLELGKVLAYFNGRAITEGTTAFLKAVRS